MALSQEGNSGKIPKWEKRHPGVFQQEIEELRGCGIHPDIDQEALGRGVLVLEFDWPLGDDSIKLQATYPDSYPLMRPQVKVVDNFDCQRRHLSPNGGDICLLGRDSRQWTPSWTLKKLLSEQLEDALNGTENEDPQGEPVDYWWNSVADTNSKSNNYSLVDTRWELTGLSEKGYLTLQYFADKGRGFHFQSIVTQISDDGYNNLYEWQHSKPKHLEQSERFCQVAWVKLDDSLNPKENLGKQLTSILDEYPHLKKSNEVEFAPNQIGQIFAMAHPSELAEGEEKLSWIFFVLYGNKKNFKKRNNKNPPRLRFSILKTLRAGKEDIGYRVPSVELLSSKKILLVGAGALGAPIAVELARNNCKKIHIVDCDYVEPGNSIRWPYGGSSWGKKKTEALKDSLSKDYYFTEVEAHNHPIGGWSGSQQKVYGDEDVLNPILPEVDLIIDGSASYGVTSFLDRKAREFNLPLVSLFASPTVEGGAVARYVPHSGCPICLEFHWGENTITSPKGMDHDATKLVQAPGCSELTFEGASFDLKELSLQAIRLTINTLKKLEAGWSINSCVNTLSYSSEESENDVSLPQWSKDNISKHSGCGCKS